MSLRADVVLRCGPAEYRISPDGRNLGFIDRRTEVDYLRHDQVSRCASVQAGAKEFPVNAAERRGKTLKLGFAGTDTEVVLRVDERKSYVVLEVESVRGSPIDSLVFVNAPLTLRGQPDEAFGACALSLNLATRVDALPALQTELRARAYRKFGLIGAEVAIVGAPMNEMLPILKTALSESGQLPLCKVAGPWAQEVPFNHGSYLFNFGSLVRTNVDDWIGMVKSLGFTQIDNHGGGGGFFRFGDMELDRKNWPNGWDDYTKVVQRLHEAGIGSIFHTYAFFIDKHSKYVTPVPDARLDAFRKFTLSADLDATNSELEVVEPASGMSTITGFFEHNSVVLHIDDELVTFGGVSKEAPWRFTQVKRGAFGTRAAAHAKGAKARHLKECFGLFVPNVESTLFEEIAANHAAVVNRCRFDGIYLDAIDGSSILRGDDECWYWADKFVVEIQKRLDHPAGMEMSSMWHHFWQYRTRWQAWDYPQRGQKRFIDMHAEEVHGGQLLPLHLGWWNFQGFNPPQIERTFPDVMETVGAKLIGWDAGISLTGAVDKKQLEAVPLFRRDVEILKTCEDLRHAGAFDEATKARLRRPGTEYALVTNERGERRFRECKSESHTASMAEPWSLGWKLTNTFANQPMRFRLEALMSAAGYDEGDVIVGQTNQSGGEWSTRSANGVEFAVTGGLGAENGSLLLSATNRGNVPAHGAWARAWKTFNPTLNLRKRQALGVWIDGDGAGEVVGFRTETPNHISFGAVADRYVTVNFAGRRFFTLVETESERWSDFEWGDGKNIYSAYRETIDYGTVDSLGVWLQNVPAGRKVECRIGPVKALEMVAAELKNPKLIVNGEEIVLPCQISSGDWVECDAPGDVRIYSKNGEPRGSSKLERSLPALRSGENEMRFSCEAVGARAPRVRVVCFCQGQVF